MTENTVIDFPKPGKQLTYEEAIKAFDALEEHMLSQIFSTKHLGNVQMYDLQWHLDDLATKFGVEDRREFTELWPLLRAFAAERTSLANGVNGERFYIHRDPKALERYDKSHMFKVHIDGANLCKKYNRFIDLVHAESAERIPYDDTYSRSKPDYDPDSTVRSSKLFKLAMGLMATLAIYILAKAATCLVLALYGVNFMG